MKRAPPRLLLVQPDDELRVLLRAELVERGYDAIGVPDVGLALEVPPLAPGRDAVRLILMEQSGADDTETERLLRQHPLARRWLLASAWTTERAGSPWQKVLRRPLTIEQVVREIERALPRA